MKLFITPTSPFARKVRIVVLEKNLPVKMELADPWKNFSGVVPFNPLNKIPLLFLENEEKMIYDSCVIADYLDSLNDTPRLLPLDAEMRAIVKTQEALADGITEALAAIIMAGRVASPEAIPEKWQEWQLDKVRRTIARFDQQLASCSVDETSNSIHLGDIALACSLGYLDFRMPQAIDWRANHSALAGWFENFSKRPSFMETTPPQ